MARTTRKPKQTKEILDNASAEDLKENPQEEQNDYQIFDGVDFIPQAKQVLKIYREAEGKSFLVFEKQLPYSDADLQADAGGGEFKIFLKEAGTNKILSWRRIFIEGPTRAAYLSPDRNFPKSSPALQGQGGIAAEIIQVLQAWEESKRKNDTADERLLMNIKTFQETFSELTRFQLEAVKSQAEMIKKMQEAASPTGINDVIREGIQAAVSLVEQIILMRSPDLMKLRIEQEKAAAKKDPPAAAEKPEVETPDEETQVMKMMASAIEFIGEGMRKKTPIPIMHEELKKKFVLFGSVIQRVSIDQIKSFVSGVDGYDEKYIVDLYEYAKKNTK